MVSAPVFGLRLQTPESFSRLRPAAAIAQARLRNTTTQSDLTAVHTECDNGKGAKVTGRSGSMLCRFVSPSPRWGARRVQHGAQDLHDICGNRTPLM